MVGLVSGDLCNGGGGGEWEKGTVPVVQYMNDKT